MAYGGRRGRKNEWIDVWVDGSCINNGQYGAQAGIGVWFGDDHPMNVSAPVRGCAPTNNNGEIQAATCGIRQSKKMGYQNIRIHTDSDFLIKATELWMPHWKNNGWYTNRGEPVRNKFSFQQLDDEINSVNAVDFDFVPSHSGDYGNDQADRLARQGAKRYKGY